jgi:Ca2+-binding RTX toxin-like protein
MANITGTTASETLNGSSENDTISGLDGHDVIAPGTGADTVTGGAGVDRLLLDYSASSTPVTMSALTATGPKIAINGYPAPGGTTFSGSGSGGNTGGRTATYSGFDTSQYEQLWWGPANPGAATDGSINSPSEQMTLQSFSGLVATWTGQTTAQTTSGTQTIYTKYVATIISGATGWVSAASAGITGGPEVVALINAGTFQMKHEFLGSTTLNGTYQPLNELYNSLPKPSPPPAGQVQTSVSGVFAYNDGGYDGSVSDGGANSVAFSGVERFDITGGSGDDVLTGGKFADNFVGGAGNDTLNGGAGNDTMAGGTGNDIYFVDSLLDVVTENAGEGIDEVRTAIGSRSDYSQMYALPAHVEKLTGTSAGAQGVYGNALDNIVTMGAGGDLIVMHDGGVDTVFAGGGNDFIHFGNAFTAADTIDGGAGYDTVGLIGSYNIVMGATTFTAVEKFALYSNGDATGATANNYALQMHDGNVGAGQTLMVVAQSLLAHETLFFDGSAETNGKYNIRGGRGADTIIGGGLTDQIWGGLGADLLEGGGGNDYFEYFSAAESTAAARDTILDFTRGDRINLIAIDSDGNAANGNNAFTFLGSGAFTGQAGQLRAYQVQNWDWIVEGDVNGDGVADLVIAVTTADGDPITAADFWL